MFGISYMLCDLCPGSVDVYLIYTLIQITRPLKITGTQWEAPEKCVFEMFLCGSENFCIKQGNVEVFITLRIKVRWDKNSHKDI